MKKHRPYFLFAGKNIITRIAHMSERCTFLEADCKPNCSDYSTIWAYFQASRKVWRRQYGFDHYKIGQIVSNWGLSATYFTGILEVLSFEQIDHSHHLTNLD